jgi:hypothetical protein
MKRYAFETIAYALIVRHSKPHARAEICGSMSHIWTLGQPCVQNSCSASLRKTTRTCKCVAHATSMTQVTCVCTCVCVLVCVCVCVCLSVDLLASTVQQLWCNSLTQFGLMCVCGEGMRAARKLPELSGCRQVRQPQVAGLHVHGSQQPLNIFCVCMCVHVGLCVHYCLPM